MIVQTVGAFMAVVSFGIILELPKRHMIGAGLVGAVGWLVYLLVDQSAHSVIAAAFFSSLVVALASHLFARVFKAPVTVFLVAGILPSVPGASIYRSVYYMIGNMPGSANHYLMETLHIAGAIAMAIFVMDSIFRFLQKN